MKRLLSEKASLQKCTLTKNLDQSRNKDYL